MNINRHNNGLIAERYTCADMKRTRLHTGIFFSYEASPFAIQADRLAFHQGHAYEDVELLDGYRAQYLR